MAIVNTEHSGLRDSVVPIFHGTGNGMHIKARHLESAGKLLHILLELEQLWVLLDFPAAPATSLDTVCSLNQSLLEAAEHRRIGAAVLGETQAISMFLICCIQRQTW